MWLVGCWDGSKDITLFESERSFSAFVGTPVTLPRRLSETSAPAKEETLAEGLIIALGSEGCCDLALTVEFWRSASVESLALGLVCWGERCKCISGAIDCDLLVRVCSWLAILVASWSVSPSLEPSANVSVSTNKLSPCLFPIPAGPLASKESAFVWFPSV